MAILEQSASCLPLLINSTLNNVPLSKPFLGRLRCQIHRLNDNLLALREMLSKFFGLAKHDKAHPPFCFFRQTNIINNGQLSSLFATLLCFLTLHLYRCGTNFINIITWLKMTYNQYTSQKWHGPTIVLNSSYIKTRLCYQNSLCPTHNRQNRRQIVDV